jgi:hypothetical protein
VGRALARFEAFCRSRHFPFVCVAIGVLLVLPAARNGLQTEDHFQRGLSWTLHLYSRGAGDTFQNYYAKDAGILPWFASEDLKVAFLRPLASLSLSFDYQVLPAHRAWPYLQSFLWLGVLIWAGVTLFRRVNGTWGGGALAAILFALDDARAMSVGWLAARHAVMAAALSVVALLAFDRWRREGSRAAACACPVALLCALFSSELAVSALGYFVAYSLFLDAAALRRRLVAALTYVGPSLVWLIAYSIGGYGTRGSGMYISPVDEPLQAASAIVHRLPWLLTGTFGVLPADAGLLVPEDGRAVGSMLAWTIPVAIFALLLPIIRQSATGRFWAAGLVLASVPLCSGPPGDRLLLLSALSGMAFVDLLVAAVVSGIGGRLWRITAGVMAAFWLLVHGILAPVRLPSLTHRLSGPAEWLERASESACAGALGDQQVIVLNAPDAYFGCMLAGLAWSRGCRASHFRVLYAGLETPVVERLDDRTLLVRTERGFVDGLVNRSYRSESRPFVVGQGIQLSLLQIVVVGITSTGAPKDVEFRFGRSLEDRRFRFVAWNGERYAPVELPPPGKRVHLTGFSPASLYPE